VVLNLVRSLREERLGRGRWAAARRAGWHGEKWVEDMAGLGRVVGKELRREKEGELGRFQEETRIQPKLDKGVRNSFLFSILFPIFK
jgi:hypothetical protein